MKQYCKTGSVCSARNCRNKQRKSNVSFFRFPKDIERARIWCSACGRTDLLERCEDLYRGYRLCAAHFETKMFLNDLRNRLQNHAVPTLFPSLEGSSKMHDHMYSCVSSVFSNDAEVLVEKTGELENDHGNINISERNSPTNSEISIPTKLKVMDSVCDIIIKEEIMEDYVQENVPHLSEMEIVDDIALDERERSLLPVLLTNSEIKSSLLLPATTSTSTQTSKLLSAHSPRKEKLKGVIEDLRIENTQLKRKIEDLKKQLLNAEQLITLEQYKKLTFKFCSSRELARFINIKLSQSQKQPRGGSPHP